MTNTSQLQVWTCSDPNPQQTNLLIELLGEFDHLWGQRHARFHHHQVPSTRGVALPLGTLGGPLTLLVLDRHVGAVLHQSLHRHELRSEPGGVWGKLMNRLLLLRLIQFNNICFHTSCLVGTFFISSVLVSWVRTNHGKDAETSFGALFILWSFDKTVTKFEAA